MGRRRTNILVIEAEAEAPRSCLRLLEKAGYAATDDVTRGEFDLALLDLERADHREMEILDELKGRQPSLEVIGMAEMPTIDEAKEVVRRGASDLVEKPLSQERVRRIVEEALERKEWRIQPTERPAEDEAEPPCWLEYEGAGEITIGLERGFLERIGTPVYIELPVPGQEVPRDGTLFRVLADSGTIHDLPSPVDGRVLRVNEAILTDVDETRNPGWVVRLRVEPKKATASRKE